MQLAVSSQLFGSQVLSEHHLALMRQAGFPAVEVFAAPGHFDWANEPTIRRLARALRGEGLSVSSLHAPWAPGQDIAALDASQRGRSLAAVERSVEALLALGGDVLVLHPGAASAGPQHRETQLRLAEAGIARLTQYCAVRNVRIALENPPPYELAGDNATMLGLYRRFAAEPTVQACFDTGHAHLNPEGVAWAASVPKELLLVHVSDNAGRADDHLPPGRGGIVWSDLFAALRGRRFAGCLVLELTDLPAAEAILAAGRRWMADVAEAYLR